MNVLCPDTQPKVGLESSVDELHYEAQSRVGYSTLWTSFTLSPSLKLTYKTLWVTRGPV